MGDYASTLVLAMIRRALDVQGLESPPLANDLPSRLVSLQVKREMLDQIWQKHGPVAIVRVAETVADYADHPIAEIFTGARTGEEIIERWLAIERYFHSRHRSRIDTRTEQCIKMEHVDVQGKTITAAENVATAGMLLGILSLHGASGTTLRVGNWLAFDGSFHPPTDSLVSSEHWTVGWQGFRQALAVAEPGIEWLPGIDHIGRSIEDPLVKTIYSQMLSRPGPAVSLARQAGEHCLSTRTLQRRLRSAGLTLQQLAASARVHRAARLLRDTETPLALVGLLAGYSDQPHFQRSFRNAIGPTPAEYRRMGTVAKPG